MKTCSGSRRAGRPMTLLLASLACFVALSGWSLALAGCGGSSAVEGNAPSSGNEIASMNGVELGEAVGAAWAAGMQELVTMLADRPEPAAVKADVEQLKEKYIQKLVDLGHRAAELDSGEKGQMTAEVSSALAEAADQDWYQGYSDTHAYYFSGDLEFGNLIADFNVLTQYADFELLRQQAPQEAARLGIE